MRHVTAAVLLIAMTGCAGIDPAVNAGVDAAVEGQGKIRAAAEFALCRAMSVGEWVRAYGTDPEKAAAWRVLCRSVPAELPSTRGAVGSGPSAGPVPGLLEPLRGDRVGRP